MSIEKNTNIIKDKTIKRIIQYSDDNKQINILDQRFYKRNNKYYPSVSSILNYFPKNQYFHSWLKETGFNSDIIAAKAAGEGTQVHHAVERFLNGQIIIWIEENGYVNYNLDVWKMIIKFTEFWNKEKPELVSAEYHLFSDKHEYAGTADLIVRLRGKLWLLDVKTSNSLHTSHNLQLAAYAKAWNETHDELITNTGIIWLKAATRGEDKKGEKIQGHGWQLKIIDDIERNFEMFIKIQDIYKLENPDSVPYSELLPTSVKLS
jgi:hypothetical protein